MLGALPLPGLCHSRRNDIWRELSVLIFSISFLVPLVSGTLYWKQAFLKLGVGGSSQKEAAAFYSSLGPPDTTLGEATQFVVLTANSTLISGCALDIPNRTASLSRGQVAVLASYNDNCSVEERIEHALSVAADLLLLFREPPPPHVQVKSTTLIHPARVLVKDWMPTRSNGKLQIIGIATNEGVRMGQTVLGGGQVHVTLTPRPNYDWMVKQMEITVHFQLAISVLSTGLLGAVVAFYTSLHLQTRRRTLSQRSRADQARDVLGNFPERTLDESLITDDEHDTCVVCIDDFETGNIVRTLPCNHIFHKDCIDQWLVARQTCPLCKYNILSGDIDEEMEMDVRDAANEISQGALSPRVLSQAAAMPLPPSRVSQLSNTGHWLHEDGRGSSVGSRLGQSRIAMHSVTPPDIHAASESRLSANVILLDNHSSPTLTPGIGEVQRRSRNPLPITPAVRAMSPARLNRPGVLQIPADSIRSSTSASQRVAFTNRRAAPGSNNRRSHSSFTSRTSVSPLALFTRLFSSPGQRHHGTSEWQPLSNQVADGDVQEHTDVV